MRSIKTGAHFAALCLTATLAGCSGEPSTSDIKEATNKNVQFNMMLNMMFSATAPRGQSANDMIADFKKNAVVDKSGCAQAQGAPGYMCDFRFGKPLPNGELSYTPSMKARFFQSGGSWAVEIN